MLRPTKEDRGLTERSALRIEEVKSANREISSRKIGGMERRRRSEERQRLFCGGDAVDEVGGVVGDQEGTVGGYGYADGAAVDAGAGGVGDETG